MNFNFKNSERYDCGFFSACGIFTLHHNKLPICDHLNLKMFFDNNEF